MSKTLLDLSAITFKCDYLISCDYPYYEDLREAMKLLYLTGARIEEIFDITRWHHVGGYEVTFQPQKGNNVRNVILNSDFDSFIGHIVARTTPFVGITISQFRNLFDKIKLWNRFSVGGSKATFYIFRYRYIKQMFADGMTVSQIAADMGYTSTSTPQAYLDAEVYEELAEPPPGFIDIGGIWIQKKPCVYDDGGVGIYKDGVFLNSDVGLYYTQDAVARILPNLAPLTLPSLADIFQIKAYLQDNNNCLGNLKVTGLDYWRSPNSYANCLYSLNCKGSGYYRKGSFPMIRRFGFWWLSDFSGSYRGYWSLKYDSNNGDYSFPSDFLSAFPFYLILPH